MKLTALQDVIFGSEGTAQADFERMGEINTEIGLTAMIRSLGGHSDEHGGLKALVNEKEVVKHPETPETYRQRWSNEGRRDLL